MTIWDSANLTAQHHLREIEQAEPDRRPAGICRTCGTFVWQPHLTPCEAGPGMVSIEDCEA